MEVEITQAHQQFHEKWLVFLFSLSLGVWILAIARQKKFFKPLLGAPFLMIRGIDVIKGFVLFLFAEIFFVPGIVGGISLLAGTDLIQIFNLQPQVKGWLTLLIILGGFGGVSIAYFELTRVQQCQLWGDGELPWYRHLAMGVLAWLVCYPIVLAVNQGISLSLWYFFHHPFIEQVAVQNVRRVMESPLLFSLTTFSIVTVVPLTEEFLFRGLLQSWLKQKLNNTSAAIILSSVVFACFHYSKEHGITNIELLLSLFLLSSMLGYIFERQRSLWASVGLHGFFNLMSLLMIFQE